MNNNSNLSSSMNTTMMAGFNSLNMNMNMKCDGDIGKDLYNNIVCSGGTTMSEGIAERPQKEIKALAPASKTAKKIVAPERKYIVIIKYI